MKQVGGIIALLGLVFAIVSFREGIAGLKKPIDLYADETNISEIGYFDMVTVDVFEVYGSFATRTTTENGKKTSEESYYLIPAHEGDEYRYIGNLSINKGSTFVYYNAYGLKFGSLCGDEVKCVGHWELVFTLPPVPKRGTYEVRYRILTNSNRGVGQLYFGDDPDRLPVTGIPVNLTLGGVDPNTGWAADSDYDDDLNSEIDKQMRNNGFMKGEESILILKQPGTTARNNVNRNIIRRIITRATLDPDKTYYLKIK